MKFKILSNLKFNGETYASGDTIELEEETAKGLVEDGVLKVFPKDSQVGEVPQPEETKEESKEESEDESEKGEATEIPKEKPVRTRRRNRRV